MLDSVYRMTRPTVAILMGIGAAGTIEGQGTAPTRDVVPTALFKPFTYRNVGPNRGGRSIAVAGSTTRPNEYYFGATGGGLWKSTNGGQDWRPVTDGQLRSSSVGALGVCQSNPDVVYIGTGEAQLRNSISMGDGVYGSRDGGKTWKHLGLASTSGQQAISRLRVHPTDCNLVFAAVLGDPWSPNPERGVYRSSDGGASWIRVLHRSDRAGAADLVLDPATPSTMFATIWDVNRNPWRAQDGPTSGLFKSTNGGTTWNEITRAPGLPSGKWGKVGVAVSPADSRRVYALIAAEEGGGLYLSDDGGTTWTLSNSHRGLLVREEYYIRVVADPKNRDRLYVLNAGLYRSDDAGKSFVSLRPPHGDNHDLWIDPADAERMVEANDGGGTVSVDGGRTWTKLNYPTAQLYHVVTTAQFPYHVCGAQQDNSTACVPSDGDGSYHYHVAGGESGHIAPHPTNPDVFYAGSIRGVITRYDRRTGSARNIEVWPENPQGWAPNKIKERFQWTFPIVTTPLEPEVLYVASQHLFRSRDGGHSYQRISPDLTRADPATLTGEELISRDQNSQDYYGTIFAVTVSKQEAGEIWTGSDDGLVHVTSNGATTWERVTPRDLPEWARISAIETSPHTPGTAYLAAYRYKSGDVRPYAYRTRDRGKNWTKIVTGIREDDYVRVIREDPVRKGLLYAGSEHGVYVSFDDGDHWQPFSQNLPDVQVSDLVVRDRDLVIATFGRSMYVLDDLSPLRELTGDVLAAQSHLFTPADAIRTLSEMTDGRRTRVPGANEVDAHYYLQSSARQVTLEILAPGGEVIQRFESATASPASAAERDALGYVATSSYFGWAPPLPVPPSEPGLHRVAWDMRYPSVTTFPGMILRGGGNALGPLAPPGDYSVRLTVDGQVHSRPFRVLKDPRLSDITLADLKAQFELARTIHARLDDATRSVRDIRDMKGEIDDRVRAARNESITALGAAAQRRLSAVEEELYEVGAQAQKDPLHFGGRLASKIASLIGQNVESADAAPTESVRHVFKELSDLLEVQLRELRNIESTDIARLNAALRARGLPPIRTRTVM